MNNTTKYALECLRDYTNPGVTSGKKFKKVHAEHASQVSLKLAMAKDEVGKYMEAHRIGGVQAATRIMSEQKRIGSEAAYLLAAGAWHDLPALLTGNGHNSTATKLRQFRRLRTADGAWEASVEWNAVIALVGRPEPPKKRGV